MRKIIIALFVCITACESVPETRTTPGGIKYKIISTNKNGSSAPMTSTVKIQLFETDTIHSHLPLYKMVAPPAPYIYDPLAEVLTAGVKKGDSLVVTDTTNRTTSYKILEVYVPNFKGVDTDSLIEVDKNKEINLMITEQLGYARNRIESYLKQNNITTTKTENVYIEILNKGTGAVADSGKTVGLKFVSQQIYSGKIITSNRDTAFHMPPVFTYTIGSEKMPKPVDLTVRQLGKGGRARIYVPAVIAEGNQANNPNTDLTNDVFFDIEVVGIN